MQKHTKILATLGPSTLSPTIIKELVRSGANGFRINTAHGDFKQYEQIIKAVRAAGSYPVVIDIKGPELRLHIDEPLEVRRGLDVFITYAPSSCSFSNKFTGDMNIGDPILFDDGRVRGTIKKLSSKGLLVRFQESALIQPKKTIAIPRRKLVLPALSKKDKEAIKFAIEQKVAYIALSFTRTADDITRIKRLLNGSEIDVIAKIENTQGVENASEILDVADALMIARGDLGVEISQENLPAVQKKLLRLCNQKGKIGIVATQVLESMVHSPVQTRAETTDVANAILDGADVLMLSEETAIGDYPKQCVQVITKIAKAIEQEFARKHQELPTDDLSQAMTSAAASLVQTTKVNKIVAITKSGYTARQLSRFRLRNLIIAVTPHEQIKQQLELVYGVKPFCYQDIPAHAQIPWTTQQLYKEKLIASSDVILYMAGLHTTKVNVSNLMQVDSVKDVLEYHKKKNLKNKN